MKMMSDGIIGIAILILLGWTNGPALVLLVMLLGIISLIYLFVTGQKVKLYGKNSDSSNLRMVQGIQEGIEGLKEVRILGVNTYFHKKVSI